MVSLDFRGQAEWREPAMQGYPPGGFGGPPGPPQGPPGGGGGGYGPPPGGGGYGPPPGAPPGGYGAPPGGGFAPPGGGFAAPPGPGAAANPGAAQAKVAMPAIGLIVVGILCVLSEIAGVIMNLLGAGLGAASGSSGAMGSIMGGVIGIVFNAIWMLIGGFIIFGALKMKNLQSWGLAMASAVCAALPCTSYWCCLLGLPIGIWAIIVLMDQQVKASFRA